ncbi:MAG: OmpA family protein [Desulfosarcina sp.]|nr:OmpA family protein [Desulfobacterales bacterium]
MIRLIIAAVSLTVFCAVHVSAEEKPLFQTTKEEIVKELTRPVSRTRGFVPQCKTRDITVYEKKQTQTIEKIIVVSSNDNRPRVNLKIEFDFDSYRIRPESYRLIRELGYALEIEKLSRRRIAINGHTDSDGTALYNLGLSLNRALAVKQYLTANFNITPDNLRILGYGEAMPLVSNTSFVNKQINRRVEVMVER